MQFQWHEDGTPRNSFVSRVVQSVCEGCTTLRTHAGLEVFQFVTPCNVSVGYRRFEGPRCMRLQQTQKTDAIRSSETSVSYRNMIWCHNPEDLNFNYEHLLHSNEEKASQVPTSACLYYMSYKHRHDFFGRFLPLLLYNQSKESN
jgi:hypothetical protein